MAEEARTYTREELITLVNAAIRRKKNRGDKPRVDLEGYTPPPGFDIKDSMAKVESNDCLSHDIGGHVRAIPLACTSVHEPVIGQLVVDVMALYMPCGGYILTPTTQPADVSPESENGDMSGPTCYICGEPKSRHRQLDGKLMCNSDWREGLEGVARGTTPVPAPTRLNYWKPVHQPVSMALADVPARRALKCKNIDDVLYFNSGIGMWLSYNTNTGVVNEIQCSTLATMSWSITDIVMELQGE